MSRIFFSSFENSDNDLIAKSNSKNLTIETGFKNNFGDGQPFSNKRDAIFLPKLKKSDPGKF